MTVGIPASGKSTWAKEEVLKSDGKIKRVNKDDLRAMIDNKQWSDKNEKNIVAIRDAIIEHYLSGGSSVIVDDTNFSAKHQIRLEEIAEKYGAEFEVKDFTHVPLATCILRNSKRESPVPEEAIRSIFNTFVKKKGDVAQYQKPIFDPDLPNCIIVDIDGTLAHMNGRSPYDYSKVHTDIVDETIRNIVWSYDDQNIGDYVIIVSGREDSCRVATENWLSLNGIFYSELYMRKEGDMRDDRIVKQEIYEEFIKPRYNVRFVLDDRNRVVDMWRSLGLKCLQVAPGDF